MVRGFRTTPKGRAKAEKAVQLCRECAHATWVMKWAHIDLEGNPICLTCPYSKAYILRRTNAHDCEHYVKGTPKVGEKSF